MNNNKSDEAHMLKLTLHDRLVGYLVGFHDGRNVLSFANEFKNDTTRPTLSLITSPKFRHSEKIMAEPLVTRQRLHPILSNLLPEGAMRELITQGLKVHIDNEFYIMSYLGEDLPGALVAEPMDPDRVPELGLAHDRKIKLIKFDKFKKKINFPWLVCRLNFQ